MRKLRCGEQGHTAGEWWNCDSNLAYSQGPFLPTEFRRQYKQCLSPGNLAGGHKTLSGSFGTTGGILGVCVCVCVCLSGRGSPAVLASAVIQVLPVTEGKEQGLGRSSSWAVMLSQQTSQLIPQGALEPGWPFRRVPN